MARGPRESPARRGPLGRVLLTASILVVLGASVLGLRAGLDYFAADLLVAAVRHAGARVGIEVEFAQAPVATLRGFEAGDVTVRSADGAVLLSADLVSGRAAFFFHRPFVGVSLKVNGARAALEASSGGEPASPLRLPAMPTVVSSVEFSDAVLDLGHGRQLRADAMLVDDGGAGLRLRLARLGYQEESGERVAEDLTGTLALAPADQSGSGLHFDLVVESGAMLLGPVFVDFASHPTRASGSLAVEDSRAWSLTGLEFTLGGLFGLRGDGTLGGDGSWKSADLTVESKNFRPAFAALVREPFSGVAPALLDSALEGSGSVRLRLRGPSRHGVDATAVLTIETLRTRSLEARDLAVNLPWMGASLRDRSIRKGSLRAKTLTIAGLSWKGVEASWTARPGRLEAADAHEWTTPGATLRVSDLKLEDDPKQGPRLSAEIDVVAVDLDRLGEVVGVPTLTGRMHGRLGQVRLDADALRADGGLEIGVFGGVVRLSELFVDQPFSRVPEFGLDATVEELALGELTTHLGVGRVRGVLEGYVRDLVVAAGQPVSLNADLHTVKRRGVSQTVDVRAIVQLGVLGGGDSGSITGTLLKIIDRYRYSALGLRCRLRNDVFEVRGVESDDGKDYIVKGSRLPPSVSVVSHSQVVSFSEMLRRIQRITTMDKADPADASDEGDSSNANPR